MTLRTTLTTIAAAALLAACGTLPAEAPPARPAPEPFAQARGLTHGESTKLDWWQALGDPALAALVERGLAANLDLAQAAERVQRSRALARGSAAALGPSGGLRLGAQAAQASLADAPGRSADERRSERVDAGLVFDWEIDLFGRLRTQSSAADARVAAAAADADAMRLAVGAEIAEAWLALDGAREQAAIVRSVVDNRRATLDLVGKRGRAGYAAPIDDARAAAELAAAEAEVPPLDAAASVAAHRLAVLLGETPSRFEPPPSAAPGVPAAIRVPAPAQWFAARPDLRAAEATLAAQSLDVAAIRAEFLPRVSVAGLLGAVAATASGLGAAGSASWLLGPSVSMPLFDHARIDARLAAAKAQQREALLAYRQRVLLATEEVENALVRVRRQEAQLAAIAEQVRHAERAEALARRRFDAGASDLLELLDAQRGARQAALAQAATRTEQRRQLVALYRAFGARVTDAS